MSTFPLVNLASITPVLDLAAYADGDVLFPDMPLAAVAQADARIVTLISIALRDLAKQNGPFDLFFFSAEPATGTYTANGVFTLHDTDSALFVGHVSILATDYANAAASSVATKRNIGLQMETTTGDDLYVIGVSRGVPDYVTASDLMIHLQFIRD